MADNPFECEDVGAETRSVTPTGAAVVFAVGAASPPASERLLPAAPTSVLSPAATDEQRVGLDAVAKRLLADNFILTALELHTELLESGRDVKRLRDFFSNPANFEPRLLGGEGTQAGSNHPLQRTSSVQTFDSLDMTRVSDDADKPADESVPVLEFELRKAKEVIRSLREQLTNATENVKKSSTSGGRSNDALVTSSVSYDGGERPLAERILEHERRALNFLVNEYLMQQNFKLTSVTFSEEVSDQDFEDWDDVGVNQPQPNDLLLMYRQLYRSVPNYIATSTTACQTESWTPEPRSDVDDVPESDQPFFTDLQDDGQLLNRLNEENGRLLMKNENLSLNIDRLTAEIVSLKSQLARDAAKTTADSDATDARDFDAKEKPSPRRMRPPAMLPSSRRCATMNYERQRKVPKVFAAEMERKFFDCTLTGDEERLLAQVERPVQQAFLRVNLTGKSIEQLLRVCDLPFTIGTMRRTFAEVVARGVGALAAGATLNMHNWTNTLEALKSDAFSLIGSSSASSPALRQRLGAFLATLFHVNATWQRAAVHNGGDALRDVTPATVASLHLRDAYALADPVAYLTENLVDVLAAPRVKYDDASDKDSDLTGGDEDGKKDGEERWKESAVLGLDAAYETLGLCVPPPHFLVLTKRNKQVADGASDEQKCPNVYDLFAGVWNSLFAQWGDGTESRVSFYCRRRTSAGVSFFAGMVKSPAGVSVHEFGVGNAAGFRNASLGHDLAHGVTRCEEPYDLALDRVVLSNMLGRLQTAAEIYVLAPSDLEKHALNGDASVLDAFRMLMTFGLSHRVRINVILYRSENEAIVLPDLHKDNSQQGRQTDPAANSLAYVASHTDGLFFVADTMKAAGDAAQRLFHLGPDWTVVFSDMVSDRSATVVSLRKHCLLLVMCAEDGRVSIPADAKKKARAGGNFLYDFDQSVRMLVTRACLVQAVCAHTAGAPQATFYRSGGGVAGHMPLIDSNDVDGAPVTVDVGIAGGPLPRRCTLNGKALTNCSGQTPLGDASSVFRLTAAYTTKSYDAVVGNYLAHDARVRLPSIVVKENVRVKAIGGAHFTAGLLTPVQLTIGSGSGEILSDKIRFIVKADCQSRKVIRFTNNNVTLFGCATKKSVPIVQFACVYAALAHLKDAKYSCVYITRTRSADPDSKALTAPVFAVSHRYLINNCGPVDGVACTNSSVVEVMAPRGVFLRYYTDPAFNAKDHYRLTVRTHKAGKVDEQCATVEDWVRCVSNCLPHVIPNILLNKRTEIVPLIVPAIVAHTDTKTREELIGALFNLIKRPEKRQRRVMLAGCVRVAASSGGCLEAELLPLCWEQIGHKHAERRLLVAELCAALAAHTPPPLLGSLVLSMLQQMLSEEREDEVRCALVVSVAALALYIEDQEKFNSLNELVQRVLTDASERVRDRGRTSLLPCFAVWAHAVGRLHHDVVGLYARRLTQLISVSGASQVANESIMCAYVGCLSVLTPLLFWTVLCNGPYADTTTAQHPQADTLELTEDDASCSVFCDAGETEYLRLKRCYEAHTALEWYTTWDTFDFVVRDMLPQLISFLDRLEPHLLSIVGRCVVYLRDLARTFGRGFSATKLRPLFTPSLNVPATGAANAGVPVAVNDQLAICHATFPVYCAGVLSAWQTEADWVDLRRFLRWKMLSIAENDASIQSVVVAFSELMRTWGAERWEALLAIVWESVPHKNVRVRSMCAEVFSQLAASLGVDVVKARVLPALVTLAADGNSTVRMSTLKGFATILEAHSSADEVVDKIRLQLSSLFEDADLDVVAYLVRCMAQSAPVLDATFRDEYLLPHLATLVGRLSESGLSKGRKSAVDALFEAYSALSCCFLSSNVVSERFVPPMRRLVPLLDVEHAKVAVSIIKEAESKLPASSNRPTPSVAAVANAARSPDSSKLPASPASGGGGGALTPSMGGRASPIHQGGGDAAGGVEEMRNRMVSTFRDIKGKVDQHTGTGGLFSRGKMS